MKEQTTEPDLEDRPRFRVVDVLKLMTGVAVFLGLLGFFMGQAFLGQAMPAVGGNLLVGFLFAGFVLIFQWLWAPKSPQPRRSASVAQEENTEPASSDPADLDD